MINFNTDRLVIVCYPRLSGGKFLINCLGLNDNCVFQHQDLVNINYQEKITYLHNKLDQARQNKRWTDLDLGCYQLFNDISLTRFISNKINFKSVISSTVKQLSDDSNKFFFLVAHDIPTLKGYLKFWKNPKIVFFQNYHDFIQHRKPIKDLTVTKYWDRIKGPDWPSHPPTSISDIKKLPKFVQAELKDMFNNEIKTILTPDPILTKFDKQTQQITKKINPKNCYFWDVDNYNSSELLTSNLQQCYNWLGLTIYNKQDIVNYYNDWVNTLNIITNYKTIQ